MKTIFIFVSLFTSVVVASSQFDFYPAKTKSPAPVVIYVHGGAWGSGSKEQYRFVGENLSKNNICGVIAGYTLTPQAKHPQPVNELNQVLTEVQKIKNKNCDFNSIYLVGHSAGAHMIAFWNTQYSAKSVLGLVGIEGIYDLQSLSKKWPSYKEWFLAAEFGSDESKWAAASPALLTQKNKSRWLLVHSLKDELVDVGQTENFKSKLELQKVPAELLMLKSENHFAALEGAMNSAEFKKFVSGK